MSQNGLIVTKTESAPNYQSHIEQNSENGSEFVQKSGSDSTGEWTESWGSELSTEHKGLLVKWAQKRGLNYQSQTRWFERWKEEWKEGRLILSECHKEGHSNIYEGRGGGRG